MRQGKMMEWVLLISIVTFALVSNLRMAGAEDDCGMPTWKVIAIERIGGVLCIGEGF